MSKLNMKEWINEIIQKKEVVAMPIMTCLLYTSDAADE